MPIPNAPSVDRPLADLALIEKRARRLRARAVAELIDGFFGWLDARAHRARQRELDRSLARSTNLLDFEHRMRRLEDRPRFG